MVWCSSAIHHTLFAFWEYTMTLHLKYPELYCTFFEPAAKLWYHCVFLKIKYFLYFFATASKPKAFSIPGHVDNFNKVVCSSFNMCGIQGNYFHFYKKGPPGDLWQVNVYAYSDQYEKCSINYHSLGWCSQNQINQDSSVGAYNKAENP